MIAKIVVARTGELIDEWEGSEDELLERFFEDFPVGSGYDCEIYNWGQCVHTLRA